MIIKNNKTISSIMKGSQTIDKIYKGTLVVYESFKNLTASGVSLILFNCKGVDLVDYKIFGNSKQNGEPTPDISIEIESVGEKTSNILPYPYTDTTYTGNGITWTDNGDGTITANGTATANSYFGFVPVYTWNGLISGQTYYFSGCPSGGSVDTYDMTIQNSTYDKLAKDYGSGTSYTADDNPVWVFIIIRKGVTVKDLTFKPMISLTPIVEYEPYGYKIPVKVRGKNLINKNNIDIGKALAINNGGYYNSDNSFTTKYIKIKPNSRYAITWNAVKWSCLYDKDYNFIAYRSTNPFFTTTSDTTYVKITFDLADLDIAQLEEGSQPTDYEEYQEPIITNIYLDEPLRKIRDYEDYIDFENKKVIKNIKHIDFTGRENWRTYADGSGGIYPTITYNVGGALSDGEGINCYCNRINAISRNRMFSRGDTGIATSASTIRVYYPPLTDNLDDFKTFLVSNPTYIEYILATPIEETIELPSIPTIKGTCVLEVDTTTQPSNMEVIYKGKK